MKPLYTLLCLLAWSLVHGQITFSTIPMDSQLVARDLKTNLGTVTINGQVNISTPYDTVYIRVLRNNVPKDSIYQPLTYTGNTAPFSFTYSFPAELKEYTIQVYGISAFVKTLDTTIYGLVAGDVYIIYGQSNALAIMRDGNSANGNKSEFIRVFANSDSNTANMLANQEWFRGEGDGGTTENGHAGQWGLKLGRLIVDSTHIPVAIFNGAVGGEKVSYFMRQPNYKTYINNPYGRLYYRLTKTGLENNVRAVLWSQGETDARYYTTISTYITEFDTLLAALRQDFPGFTKTYIFQTRNGGMPTYPFLNLQQIKEAQREIKMQDTSIEIMSTSSLRQDTGDLHFDYTGGYEEFANRIFRPIKRDLYGINTTEEIDAPLIMGAYLKDSTTLIVEESLDSLIRHDAMDTIQNFEIENANGAKIDTIYIQKNNIVFKLSKFPGNSMTVSYLAQPTDTGNWVMNTLGVETVCFYKYPVSDTLLTSVAPVWTYSASILYPNPNNGRFSIRIESYNIGSVLEIYSMQGEKIISSKINSSIEPVDMEQEPAGIYLYRIVSETGNLVNTGKFILQK